MDELDLMPVGAEADALASVYTYENDEGEQVELTEDLQKRVINQLVKQFENMEQDRKTKAEPIWREVEKQLEPSYSSKTKVLDIKLPFARQVLNTLQGHIWARSLQGEKVLFDVQGDDEQAQEQAPTYKALLNYLFSQNKLRCRLDLLAEHYITKGVCIAFTGRMTKTRKVRVLSGQMGTELQLGMNGEAEFVEVEQTVAELADLQVVDPYTFVFDTDNADNWDECLKAYRKPIVYEDLADNTLYGNHSELKEQVKQHIEQQSSGYNNVVKGVKASKDAKGFYPDGRVELLEFYGDVRLPNGDLLRNWMVTIAARNHVVRFEPNPYYVNPFVKALYEETTCGWGQGGPIGQVVSLMEGASRMAKQAVVSSEYAMNPPYLAPKGMLQQKQYNIKPGDVVTYEPNTMLPNALPQPLVANPNPAFPILQLLESQTEATTGATRQLSGNVTSRDKAQTATEFQGLQVIGNLVMDRVIDRFNLDMKLPAIEKLALMQSMFYPKALTIPVEGRGGENEFVQVEPSLYYQNYKFIIVDNKSEMERKQGLQEKIALIQQGAQIPDIAQRMDWVELYKSLWRDLGYGEADKWIMNHDELVVKLTKDTAAMALGQALGQQSAMLAMGTEQAMMMAGQVALDAVDAEGGLQAEGAGGIGTPVGAMPSMGGVEQGGEATLLGQLAGNPAPSPQGAGV
jgi:hypothetical protein